MTKLVAVIQNQPLRATQAPIHEIASLQERLKICISPNSLPRRVVFVQDTWQLFESRLRCAGMELSMAALGSSCRHALLRRTLEHTGWSFVCSAGFLHLWLLAYAVGPDHVTSEAMPVPKRPLVRAQVTRNAQVA